MPISPLTNGVRLAIKLTPKAAKNRFGACEENADGKFQLKAYVTTVPEDGKANKSLIKMLSKSLKLPSRDISIASGATNRNKQILIEGDPQDLMAKLEQWIKDVSS